MYDFRVVFERDESTRSMKLPLDVHGADEQGTLGAWVLSAACPCCGPESTRHEQVGEATIPLIFAIPTDAVP